ncbi:unnamed protein product [Rotaria magnacalcarata]|uniref:Tr-type G domain-containing protein n=2 Tax=Rotaria magnacalcarata TaxID=392030 RepID=A0A820BA50_9BILA|nr:unnamed protein product [Rotaria magnacalcarata]
MFIGHISTGKTTIVDRLLHSNDRNDRRTMNRNEKEIVVMDSSKTFETNKYCMTIVRTPDYRDFIQSTITPRKQADCAVLVVSARTGEFETGMSKDGQTREQALLAYTMGTKQLIVIVNKLDADDVLYSEERFHQIKTEVSNYISKVGYRPEQVAFVPVSARCDDNIFEVSDKMPWFQGWILQRTEKIVTGQTLIEAFDALVINQSLINKPFRLPVQDVFKIAGIGTMVAGRVEAGVLRPNMVVKFAPSNITATVQAIEMYQTSIEKAVPGDNIGILVKEVGRKQLRRGLICSDAQNDPAQETASFIANVIVLHHPIEITQDYTVALSCHTANIRCCYIQLLEKIDRRTGKTIEVTPKSLKSNEAAIVKILPVKPVCVETYEKYPSLGRFIIIDMKRTVAVGIIKVVEKMTVASENMATSISVCDNDTKLN